MQKKKRKICPPTNMEPGISSWVLMFSWLPHSVNFLTHILFQHLHLCSPLSTYSFIPTLMSLNYLLNETRCDFFFGDKISLFCELFWEKCWKTCFWRANWNVFFQLKVANFEIKNWKRKAWNSLAAVVGRKKVDLAWIQLCPSEKWVLFCANKDSLRIAKCAITSYDIVVWHNDSIFIIHGVAMITYFIFPPNEIMSI